MGESSNAAKADPKQDTSPRMGPRAAILGLAANELVFAVVGHAGSGTSTVAQSLKALLSSPDLQGGAYDTEIIKARKAIRGWADKSGEQLPDDSITTLETVKQYQDLGDKMRQQTTDFTSVGKGLISAIREKRAEKQSIAVPAEGAVHPDGNCRCI